MVSDSSLRPRPNPPACRHFVFTKISLRFSPVSVVCVIQAVLLGEHHHLHLRKCAVICCRASVQITWQQLHADGIFQHGTQNVYCTGTFTSHSPMASWFLSWISQSSWMSAQWWMVSITGLVSRAPGGPQLTTGLSSIWASSTGGLNKTDNSHFQPQGGQIELTSVFGCLFYFLLPTPPTIKSKLAF